MPIKLNLVLWTYAYENYYCRVGRDGTGALHPRGGRARDLPSPDPDPGRAIQQYENYYENCYENFAADDPKCWIAAADDPKFPKLENHLYWLLFQVQLYRSTGGLTLKN